jgi:uncharacterized Ntn-hydrolase superfamily protein
VPKPQRKFSPVLPGRTPVRRKIYVLAEFTQLAYSAYNPAFRGALMKRVLCILFVLCGSVLAQQRPVHTFSIVARDPATGQIGVAVQSHWFSVGSIVTWAEAGVGAVATQSFVDPSYGPLGLDLMRAGKSAPDALRGLLNTDANRNVRQVAFIDDAGKVAVWTGAKDIQAAGHVAGGTAAQAEPVPGGTFSVGENFSTEANLMSNDKIWPAMAKAYQEAKGDLADRLLAALDAAQAVGGDIRGRQSAALIVVEGKRQAAPWMGRIFDLRVDDAPEPLKELRRLVALQRAYNHMNAGDLATEHHDNEGALREYSEAEKIASSTPGVLPSRLAEMIYWHAVALVNMKRVEQALPLFKKAFSIQPGWAELTPRLPASGLLPHDPKLIQRIERQKP